MNMPRRLEVVDNSAICQDHHPLSDPEVRTESDILADKDRADCPLMEPCFSGQLQRDGVRCAALTGHVMARAIAKNNTPTTLRAEVAELTAAPVFHPDTKGFIDPYSQTPLDPETDKDKAVKLVVGYASLVMYGSEDGIALSVEQEVKDDTKPVSGTDGVLRIAADDEFDIVYPNGIPERVSRNVCRCPVTQVGDFCPVHGG